MNAKFFIIVFFMIQSGMVFASSEISAPEGGAQSGDSAYRPSTPQDQVTVLHGGRYVQRGNINVVSQETGRSQVPGGE